jgi:hypothetical protein
MSFRGVIEGASFFLFWCFVMDVNAYTLARAGIAVESPRLSKSLIGRLSPNTDYIGEYRTGNGTRSTIDSISSQPADDDGVRRQVRFFHILLTFCSCFLAARCRASFTVC